MRKERWDSEDQERTAVVRKQKEIDDGLQEIKMVALIPVDFAVHMSGSLLVCFLIYFLIDCWVLRA